MAKSNASNVFTFLESLFEVLVREFTLRTGIILAGVVTLLFKLEIPGRQGGMPLCPVEWTKE